MTKAISFPAKMTLVHAQALLTIQLILVVVLVVLLVLESKLRSLLLSQHSTKCKNHLLMFFT